MLEYEFNQPFIKDFGLENGKPSKSFVDFVNSDNLYNVYVGYARVAKQRDDLSNLVDKFGLGSICSAYYIFINYNPYYYQIERKLKEKYPPLKKKHYDMSFMPIIPYIDDDLVSELPVTIDELYQVEENNAKALKNIFDCHQLGQLYKINVSILHLSNTDRHVIQVIIDPTNNTAFILESSEMDTFITKSQEISIQDFLHYYINPELTLIIRDTQVCPLYNLQGSSDLCATWNFYLFLIFLLNPELDANNIIKVFSQYSQEERDFLILQFMYYTWTLVSQDFYFMFIFEDFNHVAKNKNIMLPRL